MPAFQTRQLLHNENCPFRHELPDGSHTNPAPQWREVTHVRCKLVETSSSEDCDLVIGESTVVHRMTSSDENTSPRARKLKVQKALGFEWQKVMSRKRPDVAREEEVETSDQFHVLSADEKEDPVNALSVNKDAESEPYIFRDLTLQ